MPYDSINKRLYIDRTTSPNKGITPDEIAQCLGDYRLNTRGQRDIGMLCTSPKINKLAKYIPFLAFGKPIKIQTEEDRKNAAYGFYWFWESQDYVYAPMANTPLELLTRAKNLGGQWKRKEYYIYRPTDFDGYRHNAALPYQYDCSTPAVNATKYASVYRRAGDIYEMVMSDMPHPSAGNISTDWLDFHIVLIACWQNNSSNLRIGYTGARVRDLDTVQHYISAEVTLPHLPTGVAERTYDLIWAATNVDPDAEDTGSDYDNLYVFLPDSLSTIKIATGLQVELETGAGGFEVYYDAATNEIDFIRIFFIVTNNYSFPIYMNYRVTMWEDGSDMYSGNSWDGKMGEMSTNTEYLEISINDFVDAGWMVMATNTRFVLTFWPVNASTGASLGAKHFDFMANALANNAASESDGVLISEIINNY